MVFRLSEYTCKWKILYLWSSDSSINEPCSMCMQRGHMFLNVMTYGPRLHFNWFLGFPHSHGVRLDMVKSWCWSHCRMEKVTITSVVFRIWESDMTFWKKKEIEWTLKSLDDQQQTSLVDIDPPPRTHISPRKSMVGRWHFVPFKEMLSFNGVSRYFFWGGVHNSPYERFAERYFCEVAKFYVTVFGLGLPCRVSTSNFYSTSTRLLISLNFHHVSFLFRDVDRDVDMWVTGGRHPFLARCVFVADRSS